MWVCSDIWVFSVLDNRLLADNLSQLPKVSIWLRKGWEEVFVYFYLAFGLLFYSDLTQTNEIWLRTSTHFCREVGYVVNTRFFGLLFYSDLTQTNEIWLRHDSDICVKKWRVKPLGKSEVQRSSSAFIGGILHLGTHRNALTDVISPCVHNPRNEVQFLTFCQPLCS